MRKGKEMFGIADSNKYLDTIIWLKIEKLMFFMVPLLIFF